MSRDNPGEDLFRAHLYLDRDDMQWFKDMFEGKIGLSKAIRTIMRDYRKRIEAQAGASAKRIVMPADLQAELVASATADRGDEND